MYWCKTGNGKCIGVNRGSGNCIGAKTGSDNIALVLTWAVAIILVRTGAVASCRYEKVQWQVCTWKHQGAVTCMLE